MNALLLFLALWTQGIPVQPTQTGNISGVLKDAQGAVIPGATVLAVHQPSGSTYEAVTQADGRFVIPVRTEARGQIPGVVHGLSSSGQTSYVEPLALIDQNNDLVRLREDEAYLEIVIADDGQGFASEQWGEAAAKPGHFGLLHMRERIGLLGGVCKIASKPGGGTTVRITVPRDRIA